MKILIDTSVLIDFLRREEKDKSPYYRAVKQGVEPAVALLTYAELYAGKSVWEKREAKKELEILLSGIEIVIPTASMAREAGRIRAKTDVSLYDAFIASTALEMELSIFTLNKNDFAPIKDLSFYETT